MFDDAMRFTRARVSSLGEEERLRRPRRDAVPSRRNRFVGDGEREFVLGVETGGVGHLIRARTERRRLFEIDDRHARGVEDDAEEEEGDVERISRPKSADAGRRARGVVSPEVLQEAPPARGSRWRHARCAYSSSADRLEEGAAARPPPMQR